MCRALEDVETEIFVGIWLTKTVDGLFQVGTLCAGIELYSDLIIDGFVDLIFVFVYCE